MGLQVLGHVNFLRKAYSAACNWTDKGPLSRVGSEVVKKVVPLSVDKRALRHIASKNFYNAPCLWVFKLIHAETTSFWDALVEAVRRKRVVFAVLHSHLGIQWNVS